VYGLKSFLVIDMLYFNKVGTVVLKLTSLLRNNYIVTDVP